MSLFSGIKSENRGSASFVEEEDGRLNAEQRDQVSDHVTSEFSLTVSPIFDSVLC